MELVNNKSLTYLDTSQNFSMFDYLTNYLKFKNSLPTNGLLKLNNSTTPNILNYGDDFLYNFEANENGTSFFSNFKINILYDNNSANVDLNNSLINFFGKDDTNMFLINFYKITIQNFLDNDAVANLIGGTRFKEFTGCIFVYHDPDSQNTPARFKYPNNNIEVSFDEDLKIDATAGKIILNATDSDSTLNSRTNTVYIPTRNGSNYSQKQIFGLVGLGNEAIGRLLGIVPYDEDSIIGRGFINQFQINDACLTEQEKINRKFIAQQHESNKLTPKIPRKQNFANIVRNTRRSKTTDLRSDCQTNNIPSSISQVKTPFRFFKTNRGNYLRSGQ